MYDYENIKEKVDESIYYEDLTLWQKGLRHKRLVVCSVGIPVVIIVLLRICFGDVVSTIIEAIGVGAVVGVLLFLICDIICHHIKVSNLSKTEEAFEKFKHCPITVEEINVSTGMPEDSTVTSAEYITFLNKYLTINDVVMKMPTFMLHKVNGYISNIFGERIRYNDIGCKYEYIS